MLPSSAERLETEPHLSKSKLNRLAGDGSHETLSPVRLTSCLQDPVKFKKRVMLRKHNKSTLPAAGAIHNVNLNESFTKKIAAETQQDFNVSIDKTVPLRNEGIVMRPSFEHDETAATCEPMSFRHSIEHSKSNFTSVKASHRHVGA